jgi:hypothetical protein
MSRRGGGSAAILLLILFVRRRRRGGGNPPHWGQIRGTGRISALRSSVLSLCAREIGFGNLRQKNCWQPSLPTGGDGRRRAHAIGNPAAAPGRRQWWRQECRPDLAMPAISARSREGRRQGVARDRAGRRWKLIKIGEEQIPCVRLSVFRSVGCPF